jgi:alpha-tubulin suppressor-like RCC1 family protein
MPNYSGMWSLTAHTQAVAASTWPGAPFSGGYLYVWGGNAGGQYGNNTLGGTFAEYRQTVLGQDSVSTTPVFASSYRNSYKILADGTMWGWGYTLGGAIGDGSTIDKSAPVQIGADTNWLTVVARDKAAIALKTNGTLWAWGDNSDGAIGDGTTTDRFTPVQIGTLTTWSKIATGSRSVYAIKTDGTLWSWGYNGDVLNEIGCLGDGTTLNRSSPVQIGTMTNWSFVRGGDLWAHAIKTDGSLWAWGTNGSANLGDGTVIARSSPVQIGTQTTWSTLGGTTQVTMAIKTDGTMWGWGTNTAGAIGDNTVVTKSSPVQVGTLTTWSSLAGGNQGVSMAAIKTDGSLWAWGNNANGAVGDGTTANRSSPVQIGRSYNWYDIEKFNTGTFYIDKARNIYATGRDINGVLGNLKPSSYRSSPVLVGSGGYWSMAIGHGGGYAIAISESNGTLWAWGYNNDGDVGDSTTINRSSPVQIGTQSNWSMISTSSSQSTVAVKIDGTLWSWGNGAGGRLGNGLTTYRSSPVQIGTLSDWTYASAGADVVYALKDNGTLWTWGATSLGSLGDNTGIDKSSPVQIGTLSTWDKVSASMAGGYALKRDGTLWAWGANSSGQLGDGTTVNRSSPVQIGTLTSWINIAGSYNTNSIFLKNDGTLWTTGDNSIGQVGDGTTINRSSPVQIGTQTDWSAIFGATLSGYAIKTNGTLWGWGYNEHGQLSQEQRGVNFSSPVQIGTQTYLTGVAHNSILHAVGTDYKLYSWGLADHGQIGINKRYYNTSASPVVVGNDRVWTIGVANSTGVTGIKIDGTLWQWGLTSGLNESLYRSSPVQVGTQTNWSKLTSSSSSIYSIKTDGTLWAWGTNTSGQIGDSTTINRSSPIQIGTQTNWGNVFGNNTHVTATDILGKLYGWGLNTTGQLGIGTTTGRSSPVQIGSGTWLSAGLGSAYTMAIDADKKLWAWGQSNRGQLGIGDTLRRSSPVQVGTLSTWDKVNCGPENTVAVKTDGTLWSWGYNNHGQIGDGTTLNRSSPVQIGTLSTWAYVYCTISQGTVYAIKTDGTLWTWGYNDNGELGNDANWKGRSSPVQVGTSTSWYGPGSIHSGGQTGFGINSSNNA